MMLRWEAAAGLVLCSQSAHDQNVLAQWAQYDQPSRRSLTLALQWVDKIRKRKDAGAAVGDAGEAGL